MIKNSVLYKKIRQGGAILSQNTSQQPTNGNIFANKIVPIINSILTISWKSEPGHKYAWKTFKKSFSGEPLFGSDKAILPVKPRPIPSIS